MPTRSASHQRSRSNSGVASCSPAARTTLGWPVRPAQPPAVDSFRSSSLASSGSRDFLDDPRFAAWSVTDNVTSAFPPTLITVGNADSLRPHSELLAEKLRPQGRGGDTLLPDDDEPLLGHEYQFNLDADAGQR